MTVQDLKINNLLIAKYVLVDDHLFMRIEHKINDNNRFCEDLYTMMIMAVEAKEIKKLSYLNINSKS